MFNKCLGFLVTNRRKIALTFLAVHLIDDIAILAVLVVIALL